MLFGENEKQDWANVLAAIDGFAEGFDISGLTVDENLLEGVVRGMREDFPAQGGIQKASPFKKAANFLCYFVAQGPIKNPFPEKCIGPDISKIHNHQNAMVGLHIAFDALEGATILRDDKEITLTNRISLSVHSFTDAIQACAKLTPSSHFHLTQVLLEQMCYRANPEASYQLMV